MTHLETPRQSGARYRLVTFGALALVGHDGATVLGRHGHHRRRLALLATLASAGARGRSRDQLLLLFWPDVPQPRARHSLDQLLYALRTLVGDELFAGTNPVALDPALIRSDVDDFCQAIERGAFDEAVALWRGAFLDGFYLDDASEFERWAEVERSRLARLYETALDRLLSGSVTAGDGAAAIRWARALVDLDPLSGRHAAALMRALAAAGDPAAALAHARQHEGRVKAELEIAADPSVRALVAELLATSLTAESSSGDERAAVTRTDATSGDTRGASIDWSASDREPAADRRESSHGRMGLTSRRTVALLAALAVVASGAALAYTAGRDSMPVLPRSATLPGAPGNTGTTSIAAHEFYERGRDPVHWRSDSGPVHALALLQQAVAIDPSFAAAHASIPLVYFALGARRQSGMETGTLRTEALRAAARALALAPRSAEAHAARGIAHSIGFHDLAAAEDALKRSLALGGGARVREHLARVLFFAGRREEALAELQRASADDPLLASAAADLAELLCANGRVDEGLARLAPLLAVRPPLLRATAYAGFCHTVAGRWTVALPLLRAALDPRAAAILGYATARSGDSADTHATRARWRAEWPANARRACHLALLEVGARELDAAFRWLERGVDDSTCRAVIMYPIFDELRADPRFSRYAAHWRL